ncbi:MAG TPA: CPBP family glutamic-type intramembrane protease, partial [Steroidobacteraceae bacterium]|nr:CPBP family glutamic-type intramembrane protease [Steroidobacteraceae bacterium]
MSNRGSPAGTFLAFVMVLLGAMLVAAVLSPWMQWMLSPIQVFPLHRVFSRLTMLGVLAGTLWLLRRKDLARREVLGYDLPWPAFARRLLLGLAAGLLLMTAALAPLFLLGVREWNPARTAQLPLLLLKGLGSGLLVALIEETFFRGAMQGALLRQNARRLALFAVPAFYAAVHFLGRASSVPADEVNATSGFTALSGFFSLYAHPLLLLDAFLALYFVGLLLALLRQRMGDIACCIGLHAGFVAMIAVFRKLSLPGASDWSFLVARFDGLLGTWIALLAALLCVALWRNRETR